MGGRRSLSLRPDMTTLELRDYQEEAVDWLCDGRRNAFLLDDPGLGKTIVAIEAATWLGCRRIVIVAPTVVLLNWEAEIAAWAPWWWVFVFTATKDIDRVPEGARVFVVSPRMLRSDPVYRFLTRKRWDLCIVDEAQNFKSAEAEQTRRLYGMDFESGLAGRADRTWLMTGSPVLEDSRDLWAHLYALWPETIGTRPYNWYKARFCEVEVTPFGSKIVGNKNAAELRGILKRVGLRRLKEDVLDLPPRTFEHVRLTPPTKLKEIRAIEEALPSLEEIELRDLRQIPEFATYRRLCGIAKVKPALEYIGRNPGKLIVACFHREVAAALVEKLPNAESIVGGDSHLSKRDKVEWFEETEDAILVLQIEAGGVGITLVSADRMIFVESSVTPAKNLQCADRCYRIGQTKPVRVEFLSLADTVDARVTEIVRHKTTLSAELLE